MSDQLQIITINSGEIPECPECGSKKWIVHDRVQRSRELIRVDNLGDLECKKADLINIVQSVLMQCSSCQLEYYPDSAVNSMDSNTNTQAEQVNAYEQDTKILYDFPSSITNLSSWR